MANRLVLNLRHNANTREDSEFRTRTGLEPPAFAEGPVIGNIGAPLRVLPIEWDEDMSESGELFKTENFQVANDLEARVENADAIRTADEQGGNGEIRETQQ